MWRLPAPELCYNADMIEMWRARALVVLISEKRCISSQPLELCYNVDMIEMWRARALVVLISEKRCVSSQLPELSYNEARGPIYC